MGLMGRTGSVRREGMKEDSEKVSIGTVPCSPKDPLGTIAITLSLASSVL